MTSEASCRLPVPPTPLVGVGAVLGFLERAAASVAFECLAVLPIEGCTTVSPRAARHLYQRVLATDVRLHILYPERARSSSGVLDHARWSVALGAAVRTAVAPPPNMLIFDRRLVLLPMDQADRGKGSALVEDGSVVSALRHSFDQAWDTGEPLGEPAARGAGSELTDTERRLLRLLAAGSTDERAGKQLGMSLRTVRRMAARLMERLGAVSRFEAGHKATRRGWL
ncbi:helix-turn-helix transcriptional regulator [Streptacidiphilus sp. PB12-B1b]|uniref:helix-turn-helix transcriptional regulator n=1 Tax=Streptacidiphilus sp. PB12-B1b TaxID=2705012 RepID=UPI0015F950EC|nr:helix-turn-helix transcriptional regulator [Streptacidiphilus sp. PB12-B1b]QMU77390.1 helix-turn-helix transcriptional regulator [Streptacidiphilus sp. PB12-B1b]